MSPALSTLCASLGSLGVLFAVPQPATIVQAAVDSRFIDSLMKWFQGTVVESFGGAAVFDLQTPRVCVFAGPEMVSGQPSRVIKRRQRLFALRSRQMTQVLCCQFHLGAMDATYCPCGVSRSRFYSSLLQEWLTGAD